MNIEELEEKHNVLRTSSIYFDVIGHTKLSIEFAISVLEDLKFRSDLMSDMSSKTHGYRFLQDKIKELKQYLDE